MWGAPGEFINVGPNSRLKENVWLATYGGSIDVGSRVLIGRNAVIYGHGGVRIGASALIGPNTVICASDHVFWKTGSIQTQGFTRQSVEIGENVWIGAGAIVLAGVNIAPNVVVGAGAVVTTDLATASVYAGNPARRIGALDSDRQKGPISWLPDPNK